MSWYFSLSKMWRKVKSDTNQTTLMSILCDYFYRPWSQSLYRVSYTSGLTWYSATNSEDLRLSEPLMSSTILHTRAVSIWTPYQTQWWKMYVLMSIPNWIYNYVLIQLLSKNGVTFDSSNLHYLFECLPEIWTYLIVGLGKPDPELWSDSFTTDDWAPPTSQLSYAYCKC